MSEPDLTGRVLDGKYRLLRLLGEGGMGSVWEAEHELIGRKVAVKVLHASLEDSADMPERFLREARTAAAVDHPGIVDVEDVGRTEEGTLYIVMELLDGESLTDRIRREGRLAPADAAGLAVHLLSALHAAHDKGVIHRDLKPDNILLTRDEAGRQHVKILDFGLSKVLSGGGGDISLTRTGTVMGTPCYMAPEQARGEKDVDARADLWAAGVILYQMVSGRLPFEGDSYNSVMARILVESVPPLAAVVPDVPEVLAAAVATALEKDRDRRWESAAAFLEELLPVARQPAAPPGDAAELLTTFDPRGDTALATPDAPLPASESEPPPPLRKVLLWYGLTLPPVWALLLMPKLPAGIYSILGLPEDTPSAGAWAAAVLLCTLLSLASRRLAHFWARGEPSRLLQGPAFLVFPVVGSLLVFRAHTVLMSRIDSGLVSFRSYAPVGAQQTEAVTRMLSTALSRDLYTSAFVLAVGAYAALLVVLAYVFLHPRGGRPALSRRFWALLPGGLLFTVLAEAVFSGVTESLGLLWPLAAFATWALAATALLRARVGRRRETSHALAMLLPGLVALVAVTGVSLAVGYLELFELVGDLPPDRRAGIWEAGSQAVAASMPVHLGVLVLLTAALAFVSWRSPAWWWAGKGLRQLGWALATLVTAALPCVTLVLGNAAAREAISLLPWRPALVEMAPAALGPSASPSFYLDRRPSSLGWGRVELFERLTGRLWREYAADRLLAALSGGSECRDALAATIGPQGMRDVDIAALPPARCVTAVEARLYCEARRKRLPTPEEWEAALGGLAPVPEAGLAGTEGPARTPLGEWTMREVHGTPSFEVKGRAAQVGTEAWSPDVGFRCAFSFGPPATAEEAAALAGPTQAPAPAAGPAPAAAPVAEELEAPAVAAGAEAARAEGTAADATLRFGDHEARLAYDLFSPVASPSARALAQVVERLAVRTPDGQVRPRALERWEERGSALDLFLRRDLQLHPHPCLPEGKARRADNADLAFSVTLAVRHGALRLPVAGAAKLLAGKADELAGVTWAAPTQGAVTLELKRPSAFVDLALTHVPLVPRELAGCEDVRDLKQPVGTGPFSFSGPTETETIVLTRSPEYWRRDAEGAALPYVRSLELHYVSDVLDAIGRLGRGELDVLRLPVRILPEVAEDAGGPRPRLKPAYESTGAALATAPAPASHGVYGLRVMLRRKGPLRARAVRRAVAAALDREALAALHPRLVRPTGRLLESRFLGYDPALAVPRFDPEAAKRLLAKAGHKGGRHLDEVVVGYFPDEPADRALAKAVREQLSAVGIRVRLAELAAASLQAAREGRSVDAWVGTVYGETRGGQPHGFLLDLADGPDGTGGKGARRLARKLRAARDREARARLYGRLEAALLKDLPLIPLAFPDPERAGDVLLVGGRVRGFFDPTTGRITAERVGASTVLAEVRLAEPPEEAKAPPSTASGAGRPAAAPATPPPPAAGRPAGE